MRDTADWETEPHVRDAVDWETEPYVHDAVVWTIERHDVRERGSRGITRVGGNGGDRSEIERPRTSVHSCRAGEAAAAKQTRCAHVYNGGGRSEIKGTRTTVQSCRCGRNRTGKADQVRSRMQWRGPRNARGLP